MRFKKQRFGKNKYVITSLNLNINHDEDLDQEFYDIHPKNYKLTDDQLGEVTEMLKLRAKPAFSSYIINEKYAINFIGKDVHNLNQKNFNDEFDFSDLPKKIVTR